MTMMDFLRRQDGLILRRQAMACGMTARMIDVKLASGAWLLAGRGLYRDASHPVTDRQAARAAVLRAGEGALLSEDSAVWLWDVSGWPLHPLQVSVPRPRHPIIPGVIVHRPTDLGRLDRTTFRGIPVTTPARTLIDMADRPIARVEDMLDEFLCRGSLSVGHLARRAQALAGPGRRSPVDLLALLDVWAQDEERSTKRELRVVRDIVAAGLPMPTRQIEVRSPSGKLIAVVDVGYEETLTAVEFQSFRWHATRRGYERDQARTARLIELGWTVYPATQDSLRNHCRGLCTWLQTRLPLAA